MNTKSKWKRHRALSTLVCMLPIAMYLAVYDKLPAQMGMQWNVEGTVNWYAPKAAAIFIVPVLCALMHLVSTTIRSNDPKRKNTSAAIQHVMDWIIPIISILAAAYSIVQNMGSNIAIPLLAPVVVIGTLLILLGNYLPKSRQNYTIGIRVPWTLGNEDNWNKTHRLAGRLWVAGGIVIVVGSFVMPDTTAILAVLLSVIALMAAIPIIYSWWLYMKTGNGFDGTNN